MNDRFNSYVETAQRIAHDKGIPWELTVNLDGSVEKLHAWNLTQMTGATPPPVIWLQHLGTDTKTLKELNRKITAVGGSPIQPKALTFGWQELIKAAVIERVYISKNQPSSIANAIVRPLKSLATCSDGAEPWELTKDHMALAHLVAGKMQKSGKLADDILGVVRILFDANFLADRCPLSSKQKQKREHPRNTKTIRSRLEERQEPQKLPTEKAFWEAVRIAWTESPHSFFDLQKFIMIRVLMMCGFRGNEASRIPLDWKRWREYTDIHGQNAGEVGGISRSLMLRHFAEKQRIKGSDSVALFETVQHIPEKFESPLIESLEEVADKTAPLRKRLQMQIETERIFPEFRPDQLVPITELYTPLTGDPFVYKDEQRDDLIMRYREGLDTSILTKINHRQEGLMRQGAPLVNGVRVYLGNRLGKGIGQQAPFRDHKGTRRSEMQRKSIDYNSDTFLIGELEEFLQKAIVTKLSDVEPFRLSDGSLMSAADMLFLAPKRALSEERNDGICDVTRYAFIGRVTLEDLTYSLSSSGSHPSIFKKYGNTDEARNLGISSHEFRHLQNTELFRLGVADTIITKRFNRRSVAQSHEYDHRTLAEELDAIDIPKLAEPLLTGKAREVFKMIAGGKVHGPIIDEFKRIQVDEGDEAAFVFLATEADGLHTTPYGHCINSFTVEPCPKALECFNGCRHLTASGMPEHTRNLQDLLERYKTLLDSIDAHPASDGAKQNMRVHAEQRLEAIERILATAPGDTVFPEGVDQLDPFKTRRTGPFDESAR